MNSLTRAQSKIHAKRVILILDHNLQDKVIINQWKEELLEGYRLSCEIMSHMNKKAHRMYGFEESVVNPASLSSTAVNSNATSGPNSSADPGASIGVAAQQASSPSAVQVVFASSRQSPIRPTPIQRPKLVHQASAPIYPHVSYSTLMPSNRVSPPPSLSVSSPLQPAAGPVASQTSECQKQLPPQSSNPVSAD